MFLSIEEIMELKFNIGEILKSGEHTLIDHKLWSMISSFNLNTGLLIEDLPKYNVMQWLDTDLDSLCGEVEFILSPNGDMAYATPSHTYALMSQLKIGCVDCVKDIYNDIPLDADVFQWLMDKTGCVAIWKSFYRMPSFGLTDMQRLVIEELSKSKYFNFK